MTTEGWYNLAKSVVFCCMEVVVKFLALVLLLVGVVGCMTLSQQPVFEVLTKEGDSVETAVTQNAVIFNITSQTGIGSAEAALVNGQMPETILFRLYLKGLEDFKFSYDDIVITTAVSSTGEQRVLRTVTEAGEPISAVDSRDFYMPVRVEADYFEIEAPANFYTSEYESFTISWIDFYR
jgi:hypothetical protein